MNCARRLVSIVALAGLCTAAHAFAAKSALRFDGFYRFNVPTNVGAMTSYLRFYPDGVVVATTTPGTLRDVTKWLNREQKPNYHYSVRGNSIQFTEDTNGASSYAYSGTIGPDSLSLRVDGYDHKQSMGYVQRTYKFVHVDFSR